MNFILATENLIGYLNIKSTPGVYFYVQTSKKCWQNFVLKVEIIIIIIIFTDIWIKMSP